MSNERCRNLKEFKAYIEGFQAGKNGLPPNAVEWAEILAELRSVQIELIDAVMPIAGQIGIPSIPYHSPIELEEGDLGVLRAGSSTPKTYGNHR